MPLPRNFKEDNRRRGQSVESRRAEGRYRAGQQMRPRWEELGERCFGLGFGPASYVKPAQRNPVAKKVKTEGWRNRARPDSSCNSPVEEQGQSRADGSLPAGCAMQASAFLARSVGP